MFKKQSSVVARMGLNTELRKIRRSNRTDSETKLHDRAIDRKKVHYQIVMK